MNRVTFTFDENNRFVRVCADEPTDVYVIAMSEPVDHAHLWTTVQISSDVVDEELSIAPVGDWYSDPSYN